MSQSKPKPVELKNPLAGNPANLPAYAVPVTLKSGETIKVADPTATRAMLALMDMQAVLGGAASHFGGPSAFAELMSASYGLAFHISGKQSVEWFEKFHLVNDAGHCENGIYALKANYNYADLTLESLKGFRSIESKLTGHGEAHLFPEGVYISNGPLGSSIGPAQGLCMADRLAGNDRVTMVAISDGACMEGEAKEAIAAISGFAARGHMNPFVLVISDNNTKLSGRIDEQSFSMEPTFGTLADLGWSVIRLEDGHDLQACAQAVEQAIASATAEPSKPVAIHATTIKGYGTEKTEKSSSGGHGFPLKTVQEIRAFIEEIYKGKDIPGEFLAWVDELEAYEAVKSDKAAITPVVVDKNVTSEKTQVGVAAAMIRKRQEGLPVVSISSDLPGSTGVAAFHKEFPESSFDVGVAEANMVSVGSGFSKQGYIPVVDTFSQFGVTKGALPLIMGSLSLGPVIAVFSHAGFQDAADGASHQALSYLAMTHAIPHVDTYCLTCSAEADALVGQAIDRFYRSRKAGEVPRSSLFFLGRENFPQRYLPDDYNYELGKAQVIYDNTDRFEHPVTIVAAGPLLHQALIAARILEDKRQGCIVVNPSIVNHPDVETMVNCLRKTEGRLLTVEDHQVVGGMGSVLMHTLVTKGVSVKGASLGVHDEFGQSAYNAIELYKKHGLDAQSIAKAASGLL